MRIQLRCLVPALLLLLGGTLFAQQQQPIPAPLHELKYFVGETQNVGDGFIYSWVQINDKNQPLALGISMTDGALNNLPNLNAEYLLRLPQVTPVPPFNHFALDWLPMGHFPEQFYGVPHFDFHFYLMTPQERSKITGFGADVARLNKPLPARYTPQGYVPAYPAVALMGLHWIRSDFPEFHGQPFTASPLYGSYNGRLTFIEPMIARDFLLTRPTVNAPMAQPAAYAVSGYYPTRYTVSYDPTRHLYTVALQGLTYRKAQ